MLDNFSISEMEQAVALNQQRAKLEVSGNVSQQQIDPIANTGVDFISIGALTKHIHAIDLSMRLTVKGH
jgi:nicotinate-nucleotide pyrophosphorylase (carboxylating)